MSQQLVLGIDVGGTNIKCGVINSAGKILARNNLITKSYTRNRNKLILAIIQGVQDLLGQGHLRIRDIQGIGIGLPGLINPPKGLVNFLPNIPGWRNVPLKRILEKHLKIPVFLENDVNMITLGEWQFGAGRGFKNIVCMTLGTGVGGGLIINNELYRGEGFVAGEIGHIPLNEKGPRCNCGGFACFERTVGNHYLQEKAARIFKKRDITLEDVGRLARQGDARALRFWEDTAVHIGSALTGVVNLLNPTRIIIGGGVANNDKFLFRTIEAVIKKRAMKVQSSMVKIVKARLGNDAGIVGSQVLVREMTGRL